MGEGLKFEVFPSGYRKVSGGTPEEIATVAAAIMAKMPFPKSSEAPEAPDNQSELPLVNGEANKQIVQIQKEVDRGPFIDVSVGRYHPAILKLEKYILAAPYNQVFEYLWMREFIGKELTGNWRECRTKAVGTLMRRLEDAGIVRSDERDRWTKVIQLPDGPVKAKKK